MTLLALNQEKELNTRMLRDSRKEEDELRLKSRQLWLKGGDSNTSYFHKQSKAKLSFNTIKELYDINGNKVEGNEAIKKHIVQHLRNIYTDRDDMDPICQDELLSVISSKISDDENEELVKPILEQEISDAMWTLQLDRASGPDGFTIKFYRAVWDIIKVDLRRMLNWTRKKEKIGGATNSSFLSLISKEKNPNYVGRFRSISLCNTSYKILTKILATRMKIS